MSALTKRVENLERAAAPQKERVFAITGNDETGRYYVAGKVYESHEELEAAFSDKEMIVFVITMPDEYLRHVCTQ